MNPDRESINMDDPEQLSSVRHSLSDAEEQRIVDRFSDMIRTEVGKKQFSLTNRENAELFQGSPFSLNYQGIGAALGAFLAVRFLPPYAKQFFSGKNMRMVSLADKSQSRLWAATKVFAQYGVSVVTGVAVSFYTRDTIDGWRAAAEFPLHSGPRSIAVTSVCPRAARLWNDVLKEHDGQFTPQSEKLKSIQIGVQNCVTRYEYEDYLRKKMKIEKGELVVVPPPGVPIVEDTGNTH